MSDTSLFRPLALGTTELAHRIVMAPLTRLRADRNGDLPTAMMAEYYGQRASPGGLIISEATAIAVTGRGYLGAPGIYSDAQVDAWKRVTDAVHAKGGHIFLQLWHVGRVSHVDMTGGQAPVAPSAIAFEGAAFTANGWVSPSPARALETDEIPGIVEAFREGAQRAMAAGFDGVEIHGANGYLLDQFLHDGSNRRGDAYGGPVANRARLLLEVTEAAIAVWGCERVGVRLSPSGKFLSMSDSDPEGTFAYVAGELDKLGVAYLHLIEPRVNGSELVAEGLAPVESARLRRHFNGVIIAAGGFEPGDAQAAVARGDADLIAFGRHFIANPDLPQRIARGLPLNAYDRETFYGGDQRGYTDYPFHQEQQ